jgi:hypothetical protein
LPFVNRTTEVVDFFAIQVHNLCVAANALSESCTTRFITPVASPLYGSGKSYFGAHVQKQGVKMRSSGEFSTLHSTRHPSRTFNDIVATPQFDKIVNARYVLFDFRYHLARSGDIMRDIRRNLIRLMLNVTGRRDEDKQFWMRQSHKDFSSGAIVKWFSCKYECLFFIHVDEV